MPIALFAIRDAVNDSTGFSPFELVYGHEVRGPLRMLKETWLGNDEIVSVPKYVVNFKKRLRKATDIARKNLSEAQNNIKSWYDKKAKERVFQPGEKVLVLFPLQGNPLKARYRPWVIEKKIAEVNYLVRTP